MMIQSDYILLSRGRHVQMCVCMKQYTGCLVQSRLERIHVTEMPDRAYSLCETEKWAILPLTAQPYTTMKVFWVLVAGRVEEKENTLPTTQEVYKLKT